MWVAALALAFPVGLEPITLSVHRFGKGEAPEGTVEAIQNAIAADPFVVLECDLRMTSDGHVIVLHDETFERTTGIDGRPEEMTLPEVKSLDAGATFSPDNGATRPWADRGVRVPTLPEVLAAAPESGFLFDVKEQDGLIETVVEQIIEAQAEDRVVLASFSPQVLIRARELAPQIKTAFDPSTGLALLAALRSPRWDSYEPPAQLLAASASQLEQLNVAADEIAALRSKGISITVFVLDRPDEIERWVAMGVDGIMSSYPSMARRVLDRLAER